MSYQSNIKNWEGLAQEDALWAILTDPTKKDKNWNEKEFFETGIIEVNTIIDLLKTSNLLTNYNTVVDFGCGVGRISRAFYPFFKKIIGIDASETMINKANEINKAYSDKIEFILNKNSHLDCLPNNSISFIYSTIVLQHIPKSESLNFISEFIKKLEKGGVLIFQIPIKDVRKISLFKRIREKLKIGEKLAFIGIRRKYQMEMNVFDDKIIKEMISANSCVLIDFKVTNQTSPSFNGKIEFIPESECKDFVSGMYIVQKL